MAEDVVEDAVENEVVHVVELDDASIKDLEKSVGELVETLKLESDDPTAEKMDELLDILKEEKQLELEKKEEEIEKLGAIEELLQKEELTEDEQAELDLLLEKQAEIEDLSEQYIRFQVENQETEINYLDIISENSILINEKLDVIIEQNEISNQTDHVVWFYGFILIPGFLITYIAYKFLNKFI